MKERESLVGVLAVLGLAAVVAYLAPDQRHLVPGLANDFKRTDFRRTRFGGRRIRAREGSPRHIPAEHSG